MIDVGVGDQPLEQLAVGGLLQVADDAALVAVVGLEVRRVQAALVGAIRIAARAFDLDHVGAEVREHHAGAGPGDERALLHDSHAAQYARCIAIVAARSAVARHEAVRGVGRRSRWRWRPRRASTKPIGRCCSSSRCAMRLAVRARIGTPLTASSGYPASSSTAAIAPDTFITSGLSQISGTSRSTSPAISMWRPATPALGGHGQQARHARILALVQRMPVAGNRLARRAQLGEHGARRRVERLAGQRVERCVAKQPRRGFGGTQDHRAAAQDSRRDRALQRFRRRGQCHAARGDARHETVFGDRHQRRIEHASLRRVGSWPVTSSQTWSVKRDVADQLAAQVVAAHHDRLRIGRGNRRAALRLRARFSLHPSASLTIFRIAKSSSINEAARSGC